jgi:hypothetical protein
MNLKQKAIDVVKKMMCIIRNIIKVKNHFGILQFLKMNILNEAVSAI